jgi:hypothetical protein
MGEETEERYIAGEMEGKRQRGHTYGKGQDGTCKRGEREE